MLCCKVEGVKQEQTDSLVGRLKPGKECCFIWTYSQHWDMKGYLLLFSIRRDFTNWFLLLRLLMQRQMTSEIQASNIPSVTVGLAEVVRRILHNGLCTRHKWWISKRISNAFMMVQKQISIDILECKFQSKCWTSLYRVQWKV